ncbi:MAG: cupin domain-containing protein [Dehalococcoidia bacterium]
MSDYVPRVVNTNDSNVTAWDFANGDNHIRQLLGADQTAGRISFFESILKPGFVVGAHSHRAEDEYWYMLDSGLQVRLDDQVIPIAAGTIVAIPAGTLHEVSNVGQESVRSIFFATPGGLENFFGGLAEIGRTGGGPSDVAALFERTGTLFPESMGGSFRPTAQ